MPEQSHEPKIMSLSKAGRTAPTLWLVAALLAVLLAGAVTWKAIHVEAPAPDFQLQSTGYENGVQGVPANFSLADYRGRTVVLDLMAVACTSCREVTEQVLKPLAAAHPGDAVTILSIDTWADPGTGASLGGETRETLIALQKDEGVPWRHALDTDNVWQKYSAVSLPRIVVISADGLVVYDHLGAPSLNNVDAAVTASLAGSAPQVPLVHLGLYGLAAVAGIASVMSPCSIGLLPAYFGLLITPQQTSARRWRTTIPAGLACAAGILLVYAALAILFGLGGAWLQGLLPRAPPVVALLMLAAGLWTLFGRGIAAFSQLGSRVGGQRGLLLFGTAFALCGFGCTGPLFLPILVAGFGIGTSAGILLFMVYAGAVAAVVVGIAALVSLGAEGPLHGILRHARRVQQASGALMIVAGAYLLLRYLRIALV